MHSEKYFSQTLKMFDIRTPIKKIAAYDNMGEPYIKRIIFLDRKCKTVMDYNPKRVGDSCVMHELGENEELIGVYGVNKPYFFTAFGFILKVKE